MILAHSELEAMYAYLGMALQGEMIQALFTALRPLVFLFLIIGVVWGIGSMMIRGRAHAVLLYLILAVMFPGAAQANHGCRYPGANNGEVRLNNRPV